jgi:hypothetical protein
LAAADTLLAAAGRDRQRLLTKPLLMPVLMAGRDRPVQRALALGSAGDVALLGGGEVAQRPGAARRVTCSDVRRELAPAVPGSGHGVDRAGSRKEVLWPGRTAGRRRCPR